MIFVPVHLRHKSQNFRDAAQSGTNHRNASAHEVPKLSETFRDGSVVVGQR